MRSVTNAVVGSLGRVAVFVVCGGVSTLSAQAPPTAPAPVEPPAGWSGSAGFGLSLNRGNTDTSNLNVTAEAIDDPKTNTVWKFKGLFQRGDTNGQRAVDRLLLEGRSQRALTQRWYAFGQLQYLRDQFKAIDYLVAPSAGIGYKVLALAMTTLSVDGGAGVKWEKNPGIDRRTSPVFTGSDRFEHKLSTTASVSQSLTALWKADDFGDALYTFSAGVAAAMTARTQLKIELLDAYATRPPTANVKSNDVAILTAVVYKFP